MNENDNRCFAAALNKYQTRSLIVLYDTVGTLADNTGSCLAQPEVLSVLMPPLMQRWNQVKWERSRGELEASLPALYRNENGRTKV